MDLRLPADTTVTARLLQFHEFVLGKKNDARPNDDWLKLRVTVSWIEQFGVLHLAWSVDNSRMFKIDESGITEKRIGFANDVSEAGRVAISWVEELVRQFETHAKKIESGCPVVWADFWTSRSWPK